jgi:hypothetical protein
MSTQARQEAVRRVVHKHLREGEWLICINTERGVYGAVFLSKDNTLVVFPTFIVKKVMDSGLDFEELVEISPRFTVSISPYVRTLQPEGARLIMKQMSRVHSAKKCHEFVNDLMCLEFGVCRDGEA